jgi:hypothetical protein
MGTKLVENHLSGLRSVAWAAGLVDAARAISAKFRSKEIKIPELAKSEWVDGTLYATISLESLDQEAGNFDVNVGNANWQILIKVNPSKPKYLTVTTKVKSHGFAVNRLHQSQFYYIAMLNQEDGSMPASMLHLAPFMRVPPFYISPADVRMEEKISAPTELTAEQKVKILSLISGAFNMLKGEGELRIRAMNLLASRFGVSIPDEALEQASSEEKALGGGTASGTDGYSSRLPPSNVPSVKKAEPMKKEEDSKMDSGSSSSSGAGTEGNFVILDPSETADQKAAGIKKFIA